MKALTIGRDEMRVSTEKRFCCVVRGASLLWVLDKNWVVNGEVEAGAEIR
jgi:hypothetical protein